MPKTKRFPLVLRICRNTAIGALMVRGFNIFCLLAMHICAKRHLSSEVRKAYLSPYDSWDNRVAIHRFIQDIPLRPKDPGYDMISKVEKDLSRFTKTPLLVCWGEKDFVFDHHFLNEWIRRFPMVEVHRFPEAGHFVLEDACEKIIPLVKDFLKSHPLPDNSSQHVGNNYWS